MKNRSVLIVLPVLVVVMMLSGCAVEPEGPATYTVRLKTFSFTSSDTGWGTLSDGYYRRQELTRTSFEWEKENNFKNSDDEVWTEEQIYSYLLGWGLSKTNAKSEAAWFVSVDHGEIGLRQGSFLYILLK